MARPASSGLALPTLQQLHTRGPSRCHPVDAPAFPTRLETASLFSEAPSGVRCSGEADWRRSSATQLLLALTLARQGVTIVATEPEWLRGRNNDASEQGDEADEASASDGASQLIPSVRRLLARTRALARLHMT